MHFRDWVLLLLLSAANGLAKTENTENRPQFANDLAILDIQIKALINETLQIRTEYGLSPSDELSIHNSFLIDQISGLENAVANFTIYAGNLQPVENTVLHLYAELSNFFHIVENNFTAIASGVYNACILWYDIANLSILIDGNITQSRELVPKFDHIGLQLYQFAEQPLVNLWSLIGIGRGHVAKIHNLLTPTHRVFRNDSLTTPTVTTEIIHLAAILHSGDATMRAAIAFAGHVAALANNLRAFHVRHFMKITSSKAYLNPTVTQTDEMLRSLYAEVDLLITEIEYLNVTFGLPDNRPPDVQDPEMRGIEKVNRITIFQPNKSNLTLDEQIERLTRYGHWVSNATRKLEDRVRSVALRRANPLMNVLKKANSVEGVLNDLASDPYARNFETQQTYLAHAIASLNEFERYKIGNIRAILVKWQKASSLLSIYARQLHERVTHADELSQEVRSRLTSVITTELKIPSHFTTIQLSNLTRDIQTLENLTDSVVRKATTLARFNISDTEITYERLTQFRKVNSWLLNGTLPNFTVDFTIGQTPQGFPIPVWPTATASTSRDTSVITLDRSHGRLADITNTSPTLRRDIAATELFTQSNLGRNATQDITLERTYTRSLIKAGHDALRDAIALLEERIPEDSMLIRLQDRLDDTDREHKRLLGDILLDTKTVRYALDKAVIQLYNDSLERDAASYHVISQLNHSLANDRNELVMFTTDLRNVTLANHASTIGRLADILEALVSQQAFQQSAILKLRGITATQNAVKSYLVSRLKAAAVIDVTHTSAINELLSLSDERHTSINDKLGIIRASLATNHQIGQEAMSKWFNLTYNGQASVANIIWNLHNFTADSLEKNRHLFTLLFNKALSRIDSNQLMMEKFQNRTTNEMNTLVSKVGHLLHNQTYIFKKLLDEYVQNLNSTLVFQKGYDIQILRLTKAQNRLDKMLSTVPQSMTDIDAGVSQLHTTLQQVLAEIQTLDSALTAHVNLTRSITTFNVKTAYQLILRKMEHHDNDITSLDYLMTQAYFSLTLLKREASDLLRRTSDLGITLQGQKAQISFNERDKNIIILCSASLVILFFLIIVYLWCKLAAPCCEARSTRLTTTSQTKREVRASRKYLEAALGNSKELRALRHP